MSNRGELRGKQRIDRRARPRVDIGSSARETSRPIEPLEGEPQAQERLPDDLWDGREVLQWGLWRDHAEQHGDAGNGEQRTSDDTESAMRRDTRPDRYI